MNTPKKPDMTRKGGPKLKSLESARFNQAKPMLI